jgi:hypothetical protein
MPDDERNMPDDPRPETLTPARNRVIRINSAWKRDETADPRNPTLAFPETKSRVNTGG